MIPFSLPLFSNVFNNFSISRNLLNDFLHIGYPSPFCRHTASTCPSYHPAVIFPSLTLLYFLFQHAFFRTPVRDSVFKATYVGKCLVSPQVFHCVVFAIPCQRSQMEVVSGLLFNHTLRKTDLRENQMWTALIFYCCYFIFHTLASSCAWGILDVHRCVSELDNILTSVPSLCSHKTRPLESIFALNSRTVAAK